MFFIHEYFVFLLDFDIVFYSLTQNYDPLIPYPSQYTPPPSSPLPGETTRSKRPTDMLLMGVSDCSLLPSVYSREPDGSLIQI